MTTYQRPGVYVEETLLPLADPAASTSDAVAAFVGTYANGPIGPTLVTSWTQFRALFGGLDSTSDLGYGVFTYFNNGGSQCYVVRAVASDAVKAKLTLKDDGTLASEAGVAKQVLDVTAKYPGVTNPEIFITVDAGSTGRFNLTVQVGQDSNLVATERFVDLSLDPADNRNALTIVNSETIGSKYVSLALDAAVASTAVFGTDYGNPVAVSATALTGGSDGTAQPDLFSATELLSQVDGNISLNLPGVSDTTVLTDVINWAETQGNVFVVVDGPEPAPNDTAATIATALTTLATGLPASSHAAVYGPWIVIADPSGPTGSLRPTAPGGAVLGQYAYNDVTRGVQKVPAGVNTALKGVINVAASFDGATLDSLNTKGVNVIRSVPGSGFCIMGGRTLNPGMPDRYINIRRSLMFVERDLVNLTRFAIFEVNDDDTWENIRAVVDQYLNTQFQVGLLSGSTPDQAYYVICDSTNNDAASVNAGVVNVEVGVALNSPAEFIVIRIGQFDGGSSVTDTAA